jgi:hypothetical protein
MSYDPNSKDTQQDHLAPATSALFGIATCGLTEDDREAARRLGNDLYDQLTRDQHDPLGFGPGIPVAIDIEMNWYGNSELRTFAEQVLLVIVAGTDSILLEPKEAADLLDSFSCHRTELSKLLVPTDSRWQGEAQRMPSVTVAGAVLDRDPLSDVTDSVVLAATQHLDNLAKQSRFKDSSPLLSANKPTLFVSGMIDRWPSSLRANSQHEGNHANSLASYFQSACPIDNSDSKEHASAKRPLGGVLLISRDSKVGDTSLHDRDRIVAKKFGWPIVQITTQDNWQLALRLAAVAHLQQKHFHLVARRIVDAAGLPLNTSIIGNAPDLFDMTIGELSKTPTRTVLHPDPALTPENREVIRSAAPLVQAVTPSTLMGRGVREDLAGRLVTPLDRKRIGLSVSSIPADDFRLGQTELHLEDAIVQITRSLIGAGASITYGGAFLLGDERSFTILLSELIEAHNQTAAMPAERLCVFQAASSELSDVPESVQCRIRHLSKSANLAVPSKVNANEWGKLPTGLEYSDMRSAMTAETDARIAIGGKPLPKNGEGSFGFSGRFSGIAEEVVRALKADQPVYLCGGFGGITHRLAQLMEHPDCVDDFWDDRQYGFNKAFTSLAWDVDNHPASKRLGLPANLMGLAKEVAVFAGDLEKDDEAWLDFNGLTYEKNRVLWNTVDPILLSSLVCEGLMRWRSRQTSMSKRYQVEVIHGNVSAVTRADVLAISVFDDVDPQGAGAAIDRVTGGIVSQAQQVPGRLIGVRSDQLDVDYLCALSLGSVTDGDGDPATVVAAVTKAAREIMELCVNEGFDALAVVTFGGSSLKPFDIAVDAMLKGFLAIESNVLIKWIEYDQSKFDQLVNFLDASGKADVTTVLKPSEAKPMTQYPWFNLTVKYNDGVLDITALAREGTGVAWARNIEIGEEEVEKLCNGTGVTGNQTPPLSELEERGLLLSKMLFGEYADEFWRRCHDVPLAITHNAAASKIPFEMIRFEVPGVSESAPAVGKGIHRWLAVGGGRMSNSFGRPRLSRKLRIGLVIDPTDDLPGARAEGIAVQKVLHALGDKVQLQALGADNASADIQNVTDLLRQVDVLHYCGHAFFSEEDRSKSGLLLAGGKTLTSERLEAISPIPRVMIFNACQAGRVRGERSSVRHESFSLAEMVLRGGVEAFLGTFWEVGDAAAKQFAEELYAQLGSGLSFRESVTIARRKLKSEMQRDWANYCLYGDGRFQLA